MKARHLEIFHAIMRNGTITDAARQLGISQPAVSKAIALAESDLKLKLFRRVRGRLFPTLEAESLFPDADRLMRELGAIQRHATDLRDGKAGLLRMAASSSLAVSIVPAALANFRRDKPGVQIVSHLLPAADVAAMVGSNEVDLGLTLSPVVIPGLRVRSLAATEMACALPESHPLAARDVIHPGDLAGLPLISFSSQTFFGRLLDEAFEQEGATRRVTIELAMALHAGTLVRAGAGVGILDGFLPMVGIAGIVWRPFRPRVLLPVNLVTAETRPASRFAAEFEPYLKAAIEEAEGSRPLAPAAPPPAARPPPRPSGRR
ncbi:MAG: LysR family transcriptional regulator [Alphaproteobacteria bacterium]